MPWSYEIDESLGVVTVVYEGEVTGDELRESTTELIGLQKTAGLKLYLIDATSMRLAPTTSIMDVFDLPTRQYEAEGADRTGRVAIFLPDSSPALEMVQFYETVSANRGWMVRRFVAHDDALAWLVREQP